eukprot:Skav204158  [mRNA]  locus=scaffold903:300434:304362:- [translate_table: standard]
MSSAKALPSGHDRGAAVPARNNRAPARRRARRLPACARPSRDLEEPRADSASAANACGISTGSVAAAGDSLGGCT